MDEMKCGNAATRQRGNAATRQRLREVKELRVIRLLRRRTAAYGIK
jgi:hypothetical protein